MKSHPLPLHKHIQKVFLLRHIWYNLSFREIPFKQTLDYVYTILNEKLSPDFETEIVPDNLPCSYQNCVRVSACPCRKRKIPCHEFSKCRRNSSCNNPQKHSLK